MKPRSRIQAFTLLELLVAAAITLLLAGIMIAVTAGTLGAWRRAQGVQDTAAQAALALDFLARDLQSAIVRNDPHSWLAAEVLNTTAEAATHGWLTTAPCKPAGAESQQWIPAGVAPQIADARFGLTGCWLRFFSAKADSNAAARDLSAPTAVGYQILRRRTGGEIHYRLFRSEVRQTASVSGRAGTFQSGYDITAGNYLLSSTTQGDAGTSMTPAIADALADNVIDFGLWFYVRAGNGDLQRVSPTTAANYSYRAPSAGTVPVAVDVMLRILTQEGARQINALESGLIARPASCASDAEWWWRIAVAHSAVYTRRIELKGAPP